MVAAMVMMMGDRRTTTMCGRFVGWLLAVVVVGGSGGSGSKVCKIELLVMVLVSGSCRSRRSAINVVVVKFSLFLVLLLLE